MANSIPRVHTVGARIHSGGGAEEHDLRPADFLNAVAAGVMAAPSEEVDREKQEEDSQRTPHRAARAAASYGRKTRLGFRQRYVWK
jgi:hypothetical protein